MKFTAISDLHGYLPKELPSGDVLCICGDIVPLDYQSDFTQSVAWFCMDFAPWADSQPYRKVVFIGGNHDFFLQELGGKHSPASVMKHLLPGPHKGQSKLVYLCDNSVEIDGIRIYGTPWIADLARWAFYKPEDELIEVYDRIPKKCDILLSHMPPRACDAGRVMQRGHFNSMENYGSQMLANAISTRDIKYALCGHVHTGNHIPESFDSVSNVVNVSLKDENYKVAFKPFTFSID
ncbi:MAG: metallophosphoesterase [Bacteroidaceae bacterium]|nr:metallophosphoesterase [Bacteroidaceae bacterium]